ncbi:HNH endonuclease family protein [Rhodococcus chondri]|uniref:HNH endonuclease family protein n=1 Tax=Rhodococcus chondri TaxID=3065941 RepID=A0ABU7JRU2_9NOCA|nr:HNH endonuclease family protein [Rhodococcus sp. CC-R104]MEE2032743.1 HNH endonuclease family protein [Rhodococcus sp. CC-R104]
MARAKKPSIPRWLWILCFIVVSVAVIVLEPLDSEGPGAVTIDGGPATPALEGLAALAVREAASQNGYERELFGSAWTDSVTVEFGRNGCDTRNDILKRDLNHISLEPATKDCTVRTGTLQDPYTGTEIFFRRGSDTSAQVQIDHVVALSDAWKKGAQQLDEQQRRNLANDPRNLLAVHGPTNQSKGDSDAAEWLPPNAAYHCQYVSRQVEVKTVYELWVTPAERDAMARVLAAC